ncbi:hypothetical protein JHFBIEKO_2496 [Methylobacterium mesophilicum]|uniref:hypothetical protein n=1 Tax=Methylobacterium mesophilicum TaxID=39956 RepID=UPI001EE19703|nr:hypothetical protein [Methylobacterium mesophilicum]GJE22045.1 hypothetical protein JHFBIEKO_2496 [Methylobacterium mesophilicum]
MASQEERSGCSAAPGRNKAQQIDFLIERQTGIPSAEHVSGLSEEERDQLVPDDVILLRNDHYAELVALPDQLLAEHYAQELRALEREVELYLQPADVGSLMRWREMDAWSLSEALSLWLDCAPRPTVNLGIWAEKNCRLTDAAVEPAERWDLICRALWVGALSDPVNPTTFVQWAANTKRSLPASFRGSLPEVTTGTATDPDRPRLNAKIAQLEGEVERLTSILAETNKPHYKLAVKLFGALCVSIYGYDSSKKRNKATVIITKIVSEHWNGRDQKSVLDYIRMCVRELPQGEKKLASLHLDGALDE